MTSHNNTNVTANATIIPPPTETPPYDILRLIFGILAILLNGFLLLAIAVERRKLLVSRISYLVTNLAVADFLTGVILVFIIQPIAMHERKQTLVDLELPLSWAVLLISFLTLFLMSAERFVVVALPMLWSTILTTRRTIIGICIIWCLCISNGIIARFCGAKAMFAMIAIMEICVIVFIGIHLYIFSFLKQPRSQPPEDGEDSVTSPWSQTTSAEVSSHVTMKQHQEIATVVAILLAVLTITIIPNFICTQISLVRRIYDTRLDDLDEKNFYLVYFYTDALSYLNFVVNPIVYAWRLSMYRRAFVKLFRLFSSCLSNFCDALFN